MNATTSSGRAWIAPTIAIAYLGVALLQGGYAITSVAWGAIAAWAIVAAMIVLRGSPRAGVPPAAIAAAACFAALAALSALSMAWADDAGRAFTAALLPGAYAGLVALVVVATPAVGARDWLAGLATGTTAVTLLALITRLDPGFLGIRDAASRAVAIGAAGRLSYPIGYWNGLAGCIAVSLVLLVWFGSEAERREVRALSVGLLPLGGLALYFTSSRGGVLAVAVGVAVLAAVGAHRLRLLAGAALGLAAAVALVLVAHGRPELLHDIGGSAERRQGLIVGLVGLALAAATAAARWSLDERLERAQLRIGPTARRWGAVALGVAVIGGVVASDPAARLRSFETDSAVTAAPGQRSLLSTSSSGRAQFWHAALDAFTSHPFGGVGAGNYELYWNAHPKAPVVAGNAHSLFLEELASLGPLGFLLALGPVVIAAVAASRRWRHAPAVAPALAVLGAAAVGAAIDWTWKIPAAFGTGVIAIALLTGPATALAQRDDASDRNFAPRRGFGLGVITLLAGWGIAWIAGIVLFAELKLDGSRAAVGRGDLTAAAGDARAASSVEPFSPEPQLQLAQIYELSGQLGQARAAAGQAIDKAPGDWRGWALAARIDRRSGRVQTAALELLRAQALAPVPLPPQFRRGA